MITLRSQFWCQAILPNIIPSLCNWVYNLFTMVLVWKYSHCIVKTWGTIRRGLCFLVTSTKQSGWRGIFCSAYRMELKDPYWLWIICFFISLYVETLQPTPWPWATPKCRLTSPNMWDLRLFDYLGIDTSSQSDGPDLLKHCLRLLCLDHP